MISSDPGAECRGGSCDVKSFKKIFRCNNVQSNLNERSLDVKVGLKGV